MENVKELLNQVYGRLENKRRELVRALGTQALPVGSGYYNGHYHRDGNGAYRMDYYPIPVISVKDCCDIETQLDEIHISTKLPRERALEGEIQVLNQYPFEAYGVERYLEDFYLAGMTLEDMRENISRSGEREIGFSFAFPFDTDGDAVCGFVKEIIREGFFY